MAHFLKKCAQGAGLLAVVEKGGEFTFGSIGNRFFESEGIGV